MRQICLIDWKLRAFRQRINFGNFHQFFHHNFRLKFQIIMVSPERYSSDLSEYTHFKFEKYFLSIKTNFYVKNEKL